MGIDFGFTEESRGKSKYAKCRPYVRRVVGFYSEPPGPGSEDPWANGRVYDQVLNVGQPRWLGTATPTLWGASIPSVCRGSSCRPLTLVVQVTQSRSGKDPIRLRWRGPARWPRRGLKTKRAVRPRITQVGRALPRHVAGPG